MKTYTVNLIKHETRNIYKLETLPPNVAMDIYRFMILVKKRGPVLDLGANRIYWRIEELNIMQDELNWCKE